MTTPVKSVNTQVLVGSATCTSTPSKHGKRNTVRFYRLHSPVTRSIYVAGPLVIICILLTLGLYPTGTDVLSIAPPADNNASCVRVKGWHTRAIESEYVKIRKLSVQQSLFVLLLYVDCLLLLYVVWVAYLLFLLANTQYSLNSKRLKTTFRHPYFPWISAVTRLPCNDICRTTLFRDRQPLGGIPYFPVMESIFKETRTLILHWGNGRRLCLTGIYGARKLPVKLAWIMENNRKG